LEVRIQLVERLQTREKLAAVETELSKNIYERGVDNKGFAIIRSKDDWALFGGNKTSVATPNVSPKSNFFNVSICI
jgi:DNA-damage-inducible protein D